jgi:hypothetical protein
MYNNSVRIKQLTLHTTLRRGSIFKPELLFIITGGANFTHPQLLLNTPAPPPPPPPPAAAAAAVAATHMQCCCCSGGTARS